MSKAQTNRNKYSKNIYPIYSSIIILIFLILNVNATCLDAPSKAEFISGSTNLGIYEINDINSGKIVYIQNDLNQYPLKIKLYFDSNNESCFNSSNDIIFKLFPSGLEIGADTLEYANNGSIAEFNFALAAIAPANFQSTYLIKNIDNPSGSIGTISFSTDTTKPSFTRFVSTPTESIIKQGTKIEIEYSISDSNSGLKELKITGGTTSKTISFDGNKTYSNSIEENITTTTTYTFQIKDILGNQETKTQTYLVDSSAPTISDFQIKEYSITNQNLRAVSFNFKVEDDSFEFSEVLPTVIGDLSEINSESENLNAVCNKINQNNKSYYECNFDNIIINQINDTKTLNININAKDSIGNQINATFSTEIYYDGTGPKISSFYLENSLGSQNIFSAYDDNVTTYLTFTDESLNDISDISIYEDFDGDSFYISALRTCSFDNTINASDNSSSSGDIGDTIGTNSTNTTTTDYNATNTVVNTQSTQVATCIWDLGQYVKKYLGQESGTIIFKVVLRDKYGNSAEESINISFDNQIPEITKIELIETESIKDGLVNSGEVINFRIFIKDNNLVFDSDMIFGDFSNIDYTTGMEKKAGSCAAYGVDEDGEETYQCDFEGITAENGYIKRDVTFVVIDQTANVAKENYEVEVLKIASESREVYKVTDLNPSYLGTEGLLYLLNPLNRDQTMRSTTTAWFEGKIELKHGGDSNFELINYELISCNRDDLMPIIVSNNELYPNNLVERGNDTNAKFDFALKIDLSAHPNKADLNNKKMKCKISVLKKDDDTLYGANIDNIEMIEFEVEFSFYDLPNENLLQQNAQTILDNIDDIAFISSWFDTTYQIYDYMSKTCEVMTTANTVLSVLTTAWTTTSIALHYTGIGSGPAIAGDNIVYPLEGTTSWITNGALDLGPINLMCKFVSCKLDVQNKILDIISLGYNDVGNSLAEATCSIAEKEDDND